MDGPPSSIAREVARIRTARRQKRDQVCVAPEFPGRPEDYVYVETCRRRTRGPLSGPRSRLTSRAYQISALSIAASSCSGGDLADVDAISRSLDVRELRELGQRALRWAVFQGSYVAGMLSRENIGRNPDPFDRFDAVHAALPRNRRITSEEKPFFRCIVLRAALAALEAR